METSFTKWCPDCKKKVSSALFGESLRAYAKEVLKEIEGES